MKFNKQTKNILLICVLYFINFKNIAQTQSSELFSDNLNLNAEISFDFKELYKNTNDSTFIKSKMVFSGNGVEEDSLTVRIRVRGNFRKKICYFKPMKIEIKKKQACVLIGIIIDSIYLKISKSISIINLVAYMWKQLRGSENELRH